ncbi:GNAT family N-acetyltransferase [Cedecea sp. FDAARGOS_727]|uniref:GNAT family N-acetyltransferase n=1 Tax=Cedecea sp. FDAARGOS_727 TaxID=2545798 RepID=UPI00143E41CD|nr:GNAT family N-acetyltransferase [Cedecea sp. FDAARGOS_727]QIX97959.1 GNAT family N-acetyltransferase [Cedecea sp. FDAARGOS_727]
MILRASTIGDIEALRRVEAAAARLFLSAPELAFLAQAGVTDATTHRRAIEQNLSWLVAGSEGPIMGFCYCQMQQDSLYLAEISTHPDFQRAGVGTALLEAVFEHARRLNVKEVTLTTYRDVPWNAPWYRRHGFERVETHELSAELAECLRHQQEEGLMVLPRCAMRYLLG